MVIQTASPDESSHFSSSLHMPEYTSQGLVELLRSVAKFSIVTITFYQCYIKKYNQLVQFSPYNYISEWSMLMIRVFHKAKKTVTRILLNNLFGL